ncbi:armadillo-type protein [Multifurca ochricompacta]|uniref:Armadillo-type protein n=1 Tax=Multifurca ochricompacta TaxID=376703 RepID=A0AAD4M645_9AGAM|nr:armadillo-type protein [Multifurca ochricompacta]
MKSSKTVSQDKSKRRKPEVIHATPPVTSSTTTDREFDRLLDDLQIPSTLRPKLAGMEPSVKAAMLKSSQVLSPTATATTTTTQSALGSRGLRRVQSGSSLNIESSPHKNTATDYYHHHNDNNTPGIKPDAIAQIGQSAHQHHSRGVSVDVPTRPKSRTGFAADLGRGKDGKNYAHGQQKTLSPVQFVSVLTGKSSLELEVDILKKLRLLLRNEAASWSQDFLKAGGYSALLTRLNELLEVEWREEQHDDQLLHELLRCLKALSTSEIGCFALRSSCPTPFVQLVSLLYSDKKPGEVATRQLIVDLLMILFDLYPSSSLPSVGSVTPRREVWDTSPRSIIALPHPHQTLYSLLRNILLTPAPRGVEAPEVPLSPHEFIDALHRPRIYKTYLQELSDICRDYFWVFCHPNNTIWVLADTDEARVEKPRAPGGMTGGVEFEAMSYLTTHLRLLNAFAKSAQDHTLPKEHELSAHQLHTDLFLSGIERIILVGPPPPPPPLSWPSSFCILSNLYGIFLQIARKASTTYYPTLHLEIARYVALAGQARYELPWTLSRLIGPPPSALARATKTTTTQPQQSGRVTPVLPSPRRTEPLKFD